MAEPVTAPGSAGFSLWVCTAKLRPAGPRGPLSSTSTTCMSVRLRQAGRSVWPTRAPAWTSPPTPHLSSPEVSHKHSNHAVKAQAGGSQGSGRHGIGVAGGKGAEPADRPFIEHSAMPSAAHCGQRSLKPEAIGVRGHGDTKTLEGTARVRGSGRSLQTPSGSPGSPAGPHLEAPSRVQPGDVLRAPQGPPGHKHSVAPAVRGLQEPLLCGLVRQG